MTGQVMINPAAVCASYCRAILANIVFGVKNALATFLLSPFPLIRLCQGRLWVQRKKGWRGRCSKASSCRALVLPRRRGGRGKRERGWW